MMHNLETRCHRLLSAVPLLHRTAALGYQALCSLRQVENELPEPIAERADCFFGFHDKSPWSSCGSQLLAHLVPAGRYFNRGKIGIGLLSRELKIAARVAQSRAWNWQQGACLTWLPGNQGFAFHDIAAGRAVTRLYSRAAEPSATLQGHWVAYSLDSRSAYGFCHGALSRGMPGYGYRALEGAASARTAGVQHLDMRSGAQHTLIPMARLQATVGDTSDGWPFVTHAKLSPAGTRLFFLYRVSHPFRAMDTFAFSYDITADRLQQLAVDDCSHMSWVDESSIMVTGRVASGMAHQVVCARTGAVQSLSPLLQRDGHPWVLPDGRVVTDSYPDRQRMQSLYIADPEAGSVRTLLRYRVPLRFSGRFRCDLHPRVDAANSRFCVDIIRNGRRTLLLGALPSRQGPTLSPAP